MNPNHLFFQLALFLFLFLFLSPNKDSSLHKSHKGCFSKVYVFGDSHMNTGNAHALVGHTISATSNKPINRVSDGSQVIYFVCEALSPSIATLQKHASNFRFGVNFAIAGSTACPIDYEDDRRVSHRLMRKEEPVNLQTQVEWFEKFLQEIDCNRRNVSAFRAELGNALFWIGAMGVNDYACAITSSVPLHWLTETSVGCICKFIQVCIKEALLFELESNLSHVINR